MVLFWINSDDEGVQEYMKVYTDLDKETIEEENLDKYIHTIEELIEEDYNSIDIAAALLKYAKE